MKTGRLTLTDDERLDLKSIARRRAGDAHDAALQWLRLLHDGYPIALGHSIWMQSASQAADDALLLLRIAGTCPPRTNRSTTRP